MNKHLTFPQRTEIKLRRRPALVFDTLFTLLYLVTTLSLAPVPVSAAGMEDYRIAPRDTLQFRIFEEPDTLIVQRVSATGELPFPLIGVIQIGGLTLREAETKLRSLYIDGGFFIDPQVILVVQQYDDRSVSVLGEVNKPGQIRLPVEAPTVNIVEAITNAGGLTRLARGEAVQVTRVESDERERRFTVNVVNYLAGGRGSDASKGFQLLPGDIVFVPERNF